MSVTREKERKTRILRRWKYFCWTLHIMGESLRVPDYTYVAVPLKNVWNRRLVWEVKIAIKHRVLSHTGSKISRFFILLQQQAVAAGWKIGDMKLPYRKIAADFDRSTHSGGVTL